MHSESKRIVWHGPFYEHQGYATHNRELALLVKERIPGLLFKPTTFSPPRPAPVHRFINEHSVPRGCKIQPDLVIQCTPTVPYRENSRYHVLLTTIESHKVHPGLANRLTLSDEIWVPCRHNKRVIPPRVKLTRPVLIMPEGVNPDKFYPIPGGVAPYRGVEKLFLYHSDWSHRKGIHTLIPAWCNVQKHMPDAALLLITKHGMCTEPEAIERLLQELYALLPPGKSAHDFKILLITHTISDAELNKIYNAAYCGVLPTRGEAWSLFPCQLAAVGRPVITTAYGGHLDYLSHRTSYLLSVKGFGPLMPGELCDVCFYNFVPFPIPDPDHLEKLLLFAYNHPRDVDRRGAASRRAVIPRYTWDRAADRVTSRIEQICEKL